MLGCRDEDSKVKTALKHITFYCKVVQFANIVKASSLAALNKTIKLALCGIVAVVVVLGLLGFVGAAMSGQATSTKNVQQQIQTIPLKTNNVMGISEFSIIKQGSFYQAQIQLVDKDLVPLSSAANMKLIIRLANTDDGSDGKVIYSKAFSVQSSDFAEYQRTMTGASTGLMYMQTINSSELNFGASEFVYGEAKLTVTLQDGRVLSADTSVSE